MKNNSSLVFRDNLEEMLKGKETYEELALYLDVPISTLKSWLNGNRCPSLKTLDNISNNIGCFSYELIFPKALLENKSIYLNDSHSAFVRNLNIIFIEKRCFTIPQKLNLLNNIITDFALQSYTRKTNFKSPTLLKLDLIADSLNIYTYELLKENIK